MAAFEPELIDACRALFGPEVDVSREFLEYLQPSGAKAAFRTMAKKTHPDSQAGSGSSEEFRRLVDAYALLRRFFEQKQDSFSTTAPPPPPAREQHYYRGDVPKRQLEIGRYLFYRGVIPYRSLIEAIGWQRKQRPSIGILARRWKWLTDQGVHAVLCCSNRKGRFGEKALAMGLLDRMQVRQLLLYQRSLQARFGQFFVQSGFVSQAQLEVMLREQREHNRKFLRR